MTYYQDTEYRLARELLAALADRTTIDVGAEKGSFVDLCLTVGAPRIFAVEPYPPHLAHLRERFSGSATVSVLDCALAAEDGAATLHVAFDRSGQAMDYHHTLVAFADTDDVQWKQGLNVTCRSLGSLVREGRLPGHVGLLKIDTEGGDLAVLQGLGALECDVILIEYGCLGERAGNSPYTLADVAGLLRPRGFRDFAFVKRNDEFETIQMGTESARLGDWGNVFFLHERVRERLQPLVQAAATVAHDRLIDRAFLYRGEAWSRGEVIDGLLSGRAPSATRTTSAPAAPAPWIAPAAPGERERLLSGRPRVSIVTPSFGHARFLEQTLKSVLDQGYPDLEYIVIDGGSTDGSVDLLRRYADRLAYWESAPDRGQTDALNKGFARATGDIVAWINSDDYYYPGAIAAAVAAFRANPDLGFVYGRGDRVAENGSVIREFEYMRTFDLDALVYGVDYILQPTTFMRRQALHEVGPFDDDLHYAFDWELWMRLAKRFPVATFGLERLVAAGREHEGAKTTTGGFRRCEEIRRLVSGHTGEDLSLGALAYYLVHLVQRMHGSDLPDSAGLRAATLALLGECHELLRADHVHARTTARREVPAYVDGWAGRELRLRPAIPESAAWMCLRGIHEADVSAIGGPLVLEARRGGQSLGLGIVLVPGAFTMSWPLPSSARDNEIVVTASSVMAAQLGHTEDPRFLSFRFAELHFETDRPQGALVAYPDSAGVAGAIQRAYRRTFASTEPYGDGWAGPELRLERPVPAGARVLTLTGVHDEAMASVAGPLTLWATIDGQPLGRGVVRAQGPFTLAWPLPTGGRPTPPPSGVREGACEIIIRSATSVVPSRFWPSDDHRELTFRFHDLELRSTVPPGALKNE